MVQYIRYTSEYIPKLQLHQHFGIGGLRPLEEAIDVKGIQDKLCRIGT